MAFRIPAAFLGKPVAGSLESVLHAQPTANPSVVVPQPSRPAQNTGIDLSRHVILPGKKYGAVYEYPDLLVSLDKTHFNENWSTTQSSLRAEGAFMLNLRQYADFLNLLHSGDAYDGNGNKVQNAVLYECYRDITEVRSPWRSEWIDAKFSKRTVGKTLGIFPNNEMQITYHSLDDKGVLKEITEPLADCLMADKKPGIDIESWMSLATSQGLPTENTGSGSLYYWHPRDGAVAGFYADSGWAGLSCGRVPQYSDSALGVRAARAKI